MANYHAFGYEPDAAGADRFASALPHPTFAEAAADCMAGESREAHLWPALIQCSPTWRRGSQGSVGSCVGWGASLAVDLVAACDVVYRREAEQWRGRTVESSLYGFSRVEARGQRSNNGGDGSTGFHAAKAIRDFGALHYGVDYGGTVFKDYSGIREKQWGDTGMPDELEKYAKQRRIKTTTLITDFDSYCKAISSGFPVAICSGQGFTMSRSKGTTIENTGFATPRGEWLHCMAGIGKRGGKRPGALIWNSWGSKAHTGPHYSGIPDRPDDMPEEFRGSTFWVDAEVLDKMLKSWKDSFALSSYDGFPPRKLPSWTGGIL